MQTDLEFVVRDFLAYLDKLYQEEGGNMHAYGHILQDLIEDLRRQSNNALVAEAIRIIEERIPLHMR